MRVAFDLTPLAFPHSPGMQRVVRESLATLEQRARLQIVRLTPPSTASLGLWRQRNLPELARAAEVIGVHSFTSAFSLFSPGKRVQTIHELPWNYGVRENASWRHRLWAGPLSWRAHAVVTACTSVARQLGGKLASAGGRIHVIPWGVSAHFQASPPQGVVDELLLARYRFPEGPFALCLGAVRAKKNLRALLQGHARWREHSHSNLQIVVSGETTPDLRRDLAFASRLGIGRFVTTLGSIAEEDLPGLLRLASLVPVLSHSEGFGLPVLEALACGTPVLVPENSAQAELAGPLALRVDSANPDSIAAGIATALERREELRHLLPERARQYSWERTAQGLEELWESLA